MAKTTKKKTTAKKTTKKAASKAKAKSTEMLLVGSKTKEALKSTGLNVSSEALEALNQKVYALIADAQERTVQNGRKTVRAYDF